MATTTTTPAEQLQLLLGVPLEGALFALEVDGAKVGAPLAPRAFSSGSDGYGWTDKLTGAEGRRYQVSVQVTRIDSKSEPTARDRARLVAMIAEAKKAAREAARKAPAE